MIEKKISSGTKIPIKDKNEDIKSILQIKQSSIDWANILIKKFCEEDKAEENSYEQAQKIIDFMKETNKSLYKICLSTEFMEKLIEKCDDFTIISLFIKDFISYNTSSYDSYSYSYGGSSTSKTSKYETNKILRFLDEKIKKVEADKFMEKMFFTEIISELCYSKKNNKIENPHIFNKENLQNVRSKIKILISNLFEPYGELLKSIESLHETFIKWIMILEPSCVYEEMKFLKLVANFLAPPKSSLYAYSSPKLNFISIWGVLRIIIESCKFSYSDDDLILPFSNVFTFFELYEQKHWEELSLSFSGDLIQEFNPKELSIFFKNVINESYTEGILLFFYYFSKTLTTRKNGEIYLIYFFNEVILTTFLTKFQSEQYFKFTIAILTQYVFGLSEICTLKESHWNALISNANYVIHFDKKYMSDYYDFLKALHKIYTKQRKLLYNDREILNFLDNLKMNYSYLSDPSEKTLENYVSKTIKIKSIEEISKQVPKTYFDIETPNNIVKYKGLKNIGNICYINSFVQCLYMTLDFRKKILAFPIDKKKLPEDNVLEVLKQMFQAFEKDDASESCYDPVILKFALPEPFKSSIEQQDALEFGRIFLEIIEKLLLGAQLKNMVEDLFFGECLNTFECKECKNSNKMEEKILDLSVNFNDECYLQKEGAYDLKKMISNFVQKEEFKDKNQYFCEKCGKLSNLMIKTPTIKKLPPFLLVTANRFYFDAKLGLRRKLCHKIKECHNFTIQEVFQGSCQVPNPNEEYILYAMIIHAGASLESGHYFSLAKDFAEDYWYCFNDTVVQCLGKIPNFHRYLWDFETPYIYFYVNRAMIPIKNK